MTKIKKQAEGMAIGVLRHKTKANSFALKFGTDIYSADAQTLLMLAKSILESLKAGGFSINMENVELEDKEQQVTVPLTLGSMSKDN